MKSVKVLGFSILIAMTIAATSNAQTNPQPAQAAESSSARLVGRSGRVEIQRGNGWLTLSSGGVINTGDRVRTGIRSSAAIELGPGRVATLSENTEVQVRQSDGTPVVQLESGNMKVVSAEENIQVAAKETVIESTERPVDIEIGYEDDRINLTVNTGAVRNGAIVIRGPQQDTSKRTYAAGGRKTVQAPVAYPNPYMYPYTYPYFYVNPYGVLFPQSNFPPQGTVPPVVFNPTHPAYRPDQIVPPMSNPLAVPITPVAPVSPFRR
jgi:hypothetical protein